MPTSRGLPSHNNPWFPDEGSFDLEIWHRVKENVEQATRQSKNIPIDFWPLWAPIKAVILPFQGNSSPPGIRQQTECLVHEYELDDETLQKAQLEQYKIFQNFPTSPVPAAPNAPPLPSGANPKVSLFLERNDSDDSPEILCDTKTGNTFLDNNDKSLAQTHSCKKLLPTHSPSRQRLSEFLALQSQVSEADGFSTFPVFRNANTQRQIIPQYEGINLFHMQQIKKTVTMYAPHSPFTREILNAMVSSIGSFIPCDW